VIFRNLGEFLTGELVKHSPADLFELQAMSDLSLGMLNERIKNLRLAKGLTLQQVGDSFGISKVSVSGWESGKSHPDHKKLEQLAELLNTSIEYLVSGNAGSLNLTAAKIQIAFRSWSSLGDEQNASPPHSFVAPIHCTPGKNSFATRYPGSVDLHWQYGGIPAGSILIVDPDQTPGPLDTLLVQLPDGRVDLAKFDQTPENKKILILVNSIEYKPLQNNNVKILGVALEWQLSGKIR
jgi:transcriptional regulator with XRE-family HTH domain